MTQSNNPLTYHYTTENLSNPYIIEQDAPTRLTVGHGVHLRASTRCAPQLCPTMTHADISHPLRSCSMSRHSPYMSGLSNVHLRAGSQCPLAIPSMHGSLQRTKNAPCLFAQRISDSTYHFAAAPACAMTSSAKLSCLFSMPSPVSKRTKSLMTIFVPFALPT